MTLSTPRCPRRVLIAVLGALCGLAPRAAAQEIALPAELQLGLLTKILTFDRNVGRYGPELVVGIAFQPRNRESVHARDELAHEVAAAGELRIADMPLRLVDVPLEGDRLPDDLARTVDILYLTPLRAVDLRTLLDQACGMGLLTVTASAGEAREGAAVGMLVRDARPHIYIDLRAARRAGADLSSRLLRLAEVRP